MPTSSIFHRVEIKNNKQVKAFLKAIAKSKKHKSIESPSASKMSREDIKKIFKNT